MYGKSLLGWLIFTLLGTGLRIGLNYFAGSVQQAINPTLVQPPYNIPREIREFHQTLRIADLHSDALLWNHDLTRKNSIGHVDIPSLMEGNIALQVFSVVTQVPRSEEEFVFGNGEDQITLLSMVELWPPQTWFNLTERALYQAGKLEHVEKQMDGRFMIVTTRQELDGFLAGRMNNPQVVGGILSLEGAHSFEADLENIDTFYQAGFRIIGLTHFFDNDTGGASFGTQKGGVTPYGRALVTKLEEKDMIIDLAHASPALIQDVLAITPRPILVSHTGVQGVCPNPRNLSNQEVIQIAERGGVIGIGYGPLFNCAPGLRPIIRSIKYVADLVGVEHVALGSDYDGLIQAPFDPTGLPFITKELIKEGFKEEEIRMIMGENVFQFLGENLP